MSCTCAMTEASQAGCGEHGTDDARARAFTIEHDGHDVGWRHEDGRLYSATCHDCDAIFSAASP